MNGLHKDVFIVHSEGDKREEALAGALIPRLLDIDISVWLYEDWSWDTRCTAGAMTPFAVRASSNSMP